MTPPANDSGLADGPFRSNQFTPAEIDDLFDVLADARRRCALQSLSDAGGTASFDGTVGDVARQTQTRPVGRGGAPRIATALYHVHLPKLESVGLIDDFDPKGEVQMAEDVGDVPRSLFE